MDYKQISYGSRGDDVKQVQTLLNQNGYQLDVDGQFGPKTQAAVKDYQMKNSLAVDGIVGKNTWGALNTNNTASTQVVNDDAPQNSNTPTGDSYTKSDTVLAAEQLLAAYQQNKPVDFTYGKQDQLDAIMDQILNRDKFQYDLNGDAIYKQYAQQYAQQGKMAMMDTMGQAAAMTGGYGNSYAQSVGQQAYQGYMQQLNEMMPELYGMALDQYNQEGQQLLNQYGLLSSDRDQEYGVHRDAVSDYYTELQRLTDEARYVSEDEYGKWIDERNYNYQKDRDAVADDQWERSFKYQQERDSVADQQWAKEFEEAQRQYNEKVASSGSSSSSGGGYEMSASEYSKWNSEWALVESDGEAEALCEAMIAAGVPEELAFIFWAKYRGDYDYDNEPQDTNVTGPEKPSGSVGGGRGANGDPIVRREYYQ